MTKETSRKVGQGGKWNASTELGMVGSVNQRVNMVAIYNRSILPVILLALAACSQENDPGEMIALSPESALGASVIELWKADQDLEPVRPATIPPDLSSRLQGIYVLRIDTSQFIRDLEMLIDKHRDAPPDVRRKAERIVKLHTSIVEQFDRILRDGSSDPASAPYQEIRKLHEQIRDILISLPGGREAFDEVVKSQ